MAPALALIVARAANGVIGAGGGLPWRLKSDLAWFKARTLGKPVLMGRTTWESLPRRPLPGRPNVVLSRTLAAPPEGAWVFASPGPWLAAGAAMAQQTGVDEVMVIGGAEVYRAVWDRADRIYLTDVHLSPEGDTFLAAPSEANWTEVWRQECPPAAGDDAGFTLRVLDRRA
jgi:dihydrofolate reductase